MAIVNTHAVVSIFPEILDNASSLFPTATESTPGVVAVGKNLQVVDGKLTIKDVVTQQDLDLFGQKKLIVDLGSEEFLELNGDDTNVGLTGILPLAHGGTGATSAALSRENLNVYSKAQTTVNISNAVAAVETKVVQDLSAAVTPILVDTAQLRSDVTAVRLLTETTAAATRTYVDNVIATVSSGIVAYPTEAEVLALIPTVTPYAAKALDTKKVWAWDGTKWNNAGLSELDLANAYTDSFNSLTLNKSKSYPFLRKVRAGLNYAARQHFLDTILDCKVIGADPLYYYRIAVLENGDTSLGGDGTGIRIEKCLISTFETNGTGIIINSNTEGTKLKLNYAVGGIQQAFVTCATEPGVLVCITFDVDGLNKTYGTHIPAANSGSAGYNWIFDPVCYVAKLDNFLNNYLSTTQMQLEITKYLTPTTASNLLINREKNAPCEAFNRGGSRNGVYAYLRDCLLHAEVIGARVGYSYRIAYIQNGATISGEYGKYGIQITRILNSNEGTSSEQIILNYTDAVQLQPNRTKGGVQTFILDCPRDPVTKIKLVIDVDKMPADGTAFSINNAANIGFNARIMDCYYSYLDPFEVEDGQLFVDYQPTDNKLIVGYKSRNRWYRVILAKKTINNTFSPLGFGYANAYNEYGDLIPIDLATFTTRTEASSDYHAPLTFKAINGDTTSPVIYTTGAHGDDGNLGGNATARQKDLMIFVDGARIDLTKPFKTKANTKVEVLGVIEAFAYNTIAAQRYAIEQHYRYTINQNGITVVNKNVALEPIVVLVDNGCQAYTAGLTPITSSTYLFWGGSQKARQAIPNAIFTSGTKADFPNVLGVSIRHSVAGEFSVWMDLEYGIGNREYLANSAPLWDRPRADAAKIYPRLIEGAGISLEKGQSYKWRGGWYWGDSSASTSYDTVCRTATGDAFVKADGTYVLL